MANSVNLKYFESWKDKDPREFTKKKKCSFCKETKTTHDFTVNRYFHDGISSYCKSCKKKNFSPTKEMRKNSHLKCRYNSTLEKYNVMLKQQKNRCAICGVHKNRFKRSFHVDHKGKGKNLIVRGLLCVTCNNYLGLKERFKKLEEKVSTYLLSPTIQL